MSFRLKTIIGIALIEGMLLLLLIWMGLSLIEDTQREALSKRAETIATLFATTTKEPVLSSDLASLESFTEEVMKNPGLVYARVYDDAGRVMAQRRTRSTLIRMSSKTEVFVAGADIQEGGLRFGRVEIGLSNEGTAELLQKAKSNAGALALLEMSLVALFSFMLGSWLTRQIKALELGAKRVSGGELGHQVDVTGNDELARTTVAFNQMSSELQRVYSELQDANQELEAQVQERSRELQLIYKVSDVLVDTNTPLEQVFASVVSAIYDAQVDSRGTCTQLVFDGQSYESVNFVGRKVCVSSEIVINDEVRGRLDILCSEGISNRNAVQFVRNKKPLLDALSHKLSIMIEHRISLQDKQAIEVQLRHAQKLESVGQLAAGIAHEINTPTQYVNDNTHFIEEAFDDYRRLISRFNALARAAQSGDDCREPLARVESMKKELDIAYLDEEVPQAIKQSLDGLQRISRIVKAMKDFSHPGKDEVVGMDLKEQIETTIDVSRNEWKYRAELKTDFDTNLPKVPGLPDEFKQVVLNLVVNAAHAIEESGRKDGFIQIRTQRVNNSALVIVSDNGCGISDDIKDRIFDPFFTTKEVGSGTGQGLAIAYSIVVDKHGGTLDMSSAEGEGSEFRIHLPLEAA